MASTPNTTRPSIVRVKRRRQDPAPFDLIIEAPRPAVQKSDPSDCFATLAVSTSHTHKRRKFQLITTVSEKQQDANDLLQLLQFGARADGEHVHSNTNNASKALAEYRQVHNPQAMPDAVQQSFKVYDLLNSAADQARHPKHPFRVPDEANILQNYYPLVQKYLQEQQRHQPQQLQQPKQNQQQAEAPGKEPNVTDHESQLHEDDFVVDYYAAAEGDCCKTGSNMPIIQVRDDERWWQEGADLDSDAELSDDSNAENWYGNDYPEDDETIDSKPDHSLSDDQYSSDD